MSHYANFKAIIKCFFHLPDLTKADVLSLGALPGCAVSELAAAETAGNVYSSLVNVTEPPGHDDYTAVCPSRSLLGKLRC